MSCWASSWSGSPKNFFGGGHDQCKCHAKCNAHTKGQCDSPWCHAHARGRHDGPLLSCLCQRPMWWPLMPHPHQSPIQQPPTIWLGARCAYAGDAWAGQLTHLNPEFRRRCNQPPTLPLRSHHVCYFHHWICMACSPVVWHPPLMIKVEATPWKPHLRGGTCHISARLHGNGIHLWITLLDCAAEIQLRAMLPECAAGLCFLVCPMACGHGLQCPWLCTPACNHRKRLFKDFAFTHS